MADSKEEERGSPSCQMVIFESMTSRGMSLFFRFFFPVVWIVFIVLGWGQEDIVETDVNAIWTRQRR
jgi:hypothetical protein